VRVTTPKLYSQRDRKKDGSFGKSLRSSVEVIYKTTRGCEALF